MILYCNLFPIFVGLAEAKRRKIIELYPNTCTNEEPVLFRSSIIPWWAWLKRSYLPEAELLNGKKSPFQSTFL
jgi:hypothetical protein